jgi:ABC-type amino acid transport substrate-binding protein
MKPRTALTRAIVFVSALIINPALAQPEISILYSEIDYLFSNVKAKKGPYNKIADSLFNETHIQAFFLPPSRVGLIWQQKQADCIFPANTNTMLDDGPLLSSLPINTVKAYLFSLQPYAQVSDFNDKVIALRRGTTYGNIRNKLTAQFVELNSDEQGIQMLAKHRVDGLIAYYSDAVGAYEAVKLAMHYYNHEQPVYVASEHLVCFDNAKNKLFISQTNQKINDLNTSGKLAEWLLNSKYTN